MRKLILCLGLVIAFTNAMNAGEAAGGAQADGAANAAQNEKPGCCGRALSFFKRLWNHTGAPFIMRCKHRAMRTTPEQFEENWNYWSARFRSVAPRGGGSPDGSPEPRLGSVPRGAKVILEEVLKNADTLRELAFMKMFSISLADAQKYTPNQQYRMMEEARTAIEALNAQKGHLLEESPAAVEREISKEAARQRRHICYDILQKYKHENAQ